MSGAAGTLFNLMGAQRGAADPNENVWLSASAGTGKTQVLTARVFRLLLRGDVRPENILCLTYTKAGATEMASRINAQLAKWVLLDEGALGADLAAIGVAVSPENRTTARKLFARLLDAPGGGLQIMTIHSFCQRLLASFPAEAGLVPGFAAMEDRDAKDLQSEVLAELAVTAETGGDEAMIAALQSLSLYDGEEGTERFLAKCAAEPVAMAALPQMADDRRRWARMLIGLEFDGSAREWLVDQVTDGAFDRRFLDAYLGYQVQWGTATAHKRIAPIQAWLAATPPVRADSLAEVQLAWATKSGTPAKQQAKAIEAEAQDTAAMLCEWSSGLLSTVAQADYADRLAEALRAGQAYARLYDTAKRTRGLVDFDDLVRETARLLRSPDIGAWIAYKLDQRIDHVLVDEAQDSNTAQWDIVRALTQDFFAGEGAHSGGVRTLFTVGDFKQAIFGFQGTSPESYLAARGTFAVQADAVGRGFAGLDMADSFRSTVPILAAVDAMITAQGEAAFGLPDAIPPHGATRQNVGEVVLAQPFVAETDDDADDGDEGWIAAPVRQYAGHLARSIRALLDNPPWLSHENRPLRAGDIMILLRRRGDLAALLVARLFAENVPVAGIDRLKLIEPLAVLDLLSAVRFAVQPEDDLNTATLLRSPLFGWSDDRLLAASDRPRGRSLWDAIKSNPDYADTSATLHDLLRRADYGEPYTFLEHILSGPMQGRRRLQARLGYEVIDPIGELLTLAQGFATRHVASLQRFLDWMERSDSDIKREGTADADAVRVMTVHGSKGLQAPYVILADCTTDPAQTPDRSLSLERTQGEIEPYKVPLLPVPKAAKSGNLLAIAEAKQAKELQESLRLLYVAMTRAEEHLVMIGRAPSGTRKLPVQCWHAKADAAFDLLDCPVSQHPVWGAARVYAGDPVTGGGDGAAAVKGVAPDLPAWLTQDAPVESRPPRPLAPSQVEEDADGEAPPSPAMQAAARRGNLLHALFERLPDVAPVDREGAAMRWLAGHAADMDGAARAALVADALCVLNDAQWADLFGPDALAEVPIAAVVGQTVVTGQVDRLLLLPDRIVVVDFKTGRFVPNGPEQVRVAHIRQMAHYTAALSRIYPGRRVEAALLYSSGPRMVMLPDAMLSDYAPQ